MANDKKPEMAAAPAETKDKAPDPKADADKSEAKAQPMEVQLGDPKVFVRTGPDGRLVAVKAIVLLKEAEGHLYEVKGRVSISIFGYHELNRFASLSLIAPQYIQTPEGKKPNPWMEMDENGYVRAVWVRRVAFGLSPIGSLTLVDRSLHYDLRTYLIQELSNLITRDTRAGLFLLKDQVPQYEVEAKKKGWFLPLQGPVGLWVDLTYGDVMKALDTHTQRLRFAERNAVSITERNCLRAHPAIARSIVEANGVKPNRWVQVPVFGFRHDLNRQAIERLTIAVQDDEMDRLKAEAITQGIAPPVERSMETLQPSGEEIAEAAVAEEDKGHENIQGQEGAAASVSEPVAMAANGGEQASLMISVRAARSAMGNDQKFFKLMADAKIETTLADAPAEALKRLLTLVSREVDRLDN